MPTVAVTPTSRTRRNNAVPDAAGEAERQHHHRTAEHGHPQDVRQLLVPRHPQRRRAQLARRGQPGDGVVDEGALRFGLGLQLARRSSTRPAEVVAHRGRRRRRRTRPGQSVDDVPVVRDDAGPDPLLDTGAEDAGSPRPARPGCSPPPLSRPRASSTLLPQA